MYVVSCGCPDAALDHAARLAELALRINEAMEGSTAIDNEPLRLKMGIHSGQVIGGVIGLKLPRCASVPSRGLMATSTPPTIQLCPLDGLTLVLPAPRLVVPAFASSATS